MRSILCMWNIYNQGVRGVCTKNIKTIKHNTATALLILLLKLLITQDFYMFFSASSPSCECKELNCSQLTIFIRVYICVCRMYSIIVSSKRITEQHIDTCSFIISLIIISRALMATIYVFCFIQQIFGLNTFHFFVLNNAQIV